MEVKLCERGNGACPLCRKRKNCKILKKLEEVLNSIPDQTGFGMETVIYTCPEFEEEF